MIEVGPGPCWWLVTPLAAPAGRGKHGRALAPPFASSPAFCAAKAWLCKVCKAVAVKTRRRGFSVVQKAGGVAQNPGPGRGLCRG